MRIPRWLAWLLVASTLLTAGLLRQFHEGTPRSPYLHPVVGSLLFLGVLFLLLVSAREWRLGGVGGRGIRLGSLTPLLLMLLMEKWISLSLYDPVFYAITPVGATNAALDAWYPAFAGAGLLGLCMLFGFFSRPTGRRVRAATRPRLWPRAAVVTAFSIAGTYLVLAGLAAALSGDLQLARPSADGLWIWVLGGQALLAFSEEVYYRGLLLAEIQRLAPRLGVRGERGSRWMALVATSLLFASEHIAVRAPTEVLARQFVFTFALGLLLGMLVQATRNLHLSGGVHAWINWLLLGAVPVLSDSQGQAALPPGTYIGVSLILVFCMVAAGWTHRSRDPRSTPFGMMPAGPGSGR